MNRDYFPLDQSKPLLDEEDAQMLLTERVSLTAHRKQQKHQTKEKSQHQAIPFK